MIFAVACLSYSMIVMQKLVKHRGVSPILVNAICMVSGGAAMGITSIAAAEKMISATRIVLECDWYADYSKQYFMLKFTSFLAQNVFNNFLGICKLYLTTMRVRLWRIALE